MGELTQQKLKELKEKEIGNFDITPGWENVERINWIVLNEFPKNKTSILSGDIKFWRHPSLNRDVIHFHNYYAAHADVGVLIHDCLKRFFIIEGSLIIDGRECFPYERVDVPAETAHTFRAGAKGCVMTLLFIR